MAEMPDYMNSGFDDAEVLLAHELANLTNRNVVTEVGRNLADNPNSIMRILEEHGDKVIIDGTLRIVSPYMFIALYYDADGNVIQDGAADIHQWLSEHPDNKVEIITNSVLTSDNFMAQAMIDMDVGPRLLLTPELETAWLSGYKQGELNEAVVASEEWRTGVTTRRSFSMRLASWMPRPLVMALSNTGSCMPNSSWGKKSDLLVRRISITAPVCLTMKWVFSTRAM